MSEQLVREAGRRGLLGSIIRPGYILGDATTGVCNTDDFLVRMLKGCPAETASSSSSDVDVHVVHVTGHPRLRMNEYLSILSYYGYDVPEVDYNTWKAQLETFVSAGFVQKDEEQSALMPLFHMVTNDLPSTTRAPELDDRNAVTVLSADADRWTGVDESAGEGISREAVGRFLRYLAETKFLTWPTGRGRELPAIKADVVQAQAQWSPGYRPRNR